MKRHDIRLRKQEFSANRIRQYKDYKQLMRKHHRTNRTKTMVQFAVAVVLLVFVTGLIYYTTASRFAEQPLVEGPGISQETNADNKENKQGNFTNEVVSVIGSFAEPVGGLAGYEGYLNENLRYPLAAREGNVSGKVLVQFLVNPDSSLSDFRILQSVGSGCDEEAVRLIKEGPAWVPGLVDGELKEGGMIVPVNFELENG